MNAKCDLCENEATVHEVSLRAGVRIERHLCESCAANAGITPPPSELPPILGLLQNLMLGQGDPDIQGLFPPVVGPTPPKSPTKPASQSPPLPTQEAGSTTPLSPLSPLSPPAQPSTPSPADSNPTDLPLPSAPTPQVPKPPSRHTTMSGKSHVCNTCKLTFADFKQSGLLGCADCYKYFEAFLGPLIQRAQDGGITHVGKKPRRLHAPNSSNPSSSASSPAPSSSSHTPPLDPAPHAEPSDLAAQWLQAHKARLLELRGMLSHVIKTEQYEIAARIRDELARISLDIQRVETQGHTPWLQKSEQKDNPSTGDAPA